MSDRLRPAFESEASIVCGTTLTANRNTSVPFIFMQENDDRFGGNPRAEPLVVPSASVVVLSLIPAFRCLFL